MIFIGKLLIYFTMSFIVLSIPIADKKLYYHLDNSFSPFTSIAIKEGKRALISSKEIIIKTFTNSSSRRVDQVNNRFSAHKKNKSSLGIYKSVDIKSNEESYTHEEEKLLEKVMLQAK